MKLALLTNATVVDVVIVNNNNVNGDIRLNYPGHTNACSQ